MKSLKNSWLFVSLCIFLSVCIVWLNTGCVSSTPGTVASTPNAIAGGDPVLITNAPVYQVSPSFLAAASNLQAEVSAAAPVISALAPPAAPFIPLGQDALSGILAIITAISTGYAYVKNGQANSHAAAAAALAQTVQNASLQTQALSLAQSNGSTAEVATHLANASKPV